MFRVSSNEYSVSTNLKALLTQNQGRPTFSNMWIVGKNLQQVCHVCRHHCYWFFHDNVNLCNLVQIFFYPYFPARALIQTWESRQFCAVRLFSPMSCGDLSLWLCHMECIFQLPTNCTQFCPHKILVSDVCLTVNSDNQ